MNQSLEPDADKRTANRLAAEKLALDVLDALLAHVAKLPEYVGVSTTTTTHSTHQSHTRAHAREG